MFVSVQMLVKENTNLGRFFLEAAIKSLENFPNQLVILDNGSDGQTLDLINRLCRDLPYDVKFDTTKIQKFSELRNKTLELADPKTDMCMFVDSDEVFWENSLAELKSNIEQYRGKYCYGGFEHLVYSLYYTQGIIKRENLYPYSKDCRWTGNVHEKIKDWDSENEVDYELKWIHQGYLRPVVATALKWIYYTVLETGNADRYKYPKKQPDSNVDYLMTVEGIEHILSDRKKLYRIFDKKYPIHMNPIIREYERSKSETWQNWVTYEVDPIYGEILDNCKEIAKEKDGLAMIDYIVENKLWEID